MSIVKDDHNPLAYEFEWTAPEAGYYHFSIGGNSVPCKDGQIAHFIDERTWVCKVCGFMAPVEKAPKPPEDTW